MTTPASPHLAALEAAVDRAPVIAILRRPAVPVETLVDALAEAGVELVEVTVDTPGGLDAIRRLRARPGRPSFLIGAGTVLDPAGLAAARDAGAQFIVTPTVSAEVIRGAAEAGLPIFPGALTPTEILAAHLAGACMVKVFPVSLGGPGYLRELRGPLPFVRTVAVGGVDDQNAAAYLEAGARAVGVGRALNPPGAADADLRAVQASARRLLDAARAAVGPRT